MRRWFDTRLDNHMQRSPWFRCIMYLGVRVFHCSFSTTIDERTSCVEYHVQQICSYSCTFTLSLHPNSFYQKMQFLSLHLLKQFYSSFLPTYQQNVSNSSSPTRYPVTPLPSLPSPRKSIEISFCALIMVISASYASILMLMKSLLLILLVLGRIRDQVLIDSGAANE